MHLVLIFGPPAVGKMTVGHELARLTGFKLLHNHMTVEPVLDIFPFGSPPFGRLVNEFRRRIIEEAVASELPGLVFTYVWALENREDRRLVESYVELVEAGGGRAHFVELFATQQERLVRNETELRLEHKRSKRDLGFSKNNLLDMDQKWVMSTGGSLAWADVLPGRPCLRVDNTDVPAADVASQVVEEFGLRTPADAGQ